MDLSQIKLSVELVKRKVRERCIRNGTDPSAVTIVAVSKGCSVEQMRQALKAGIGDLGENKIQEAAEKIPEINPAPRWHMVGHLQSMKARKAVGLFDIIQSVDSAELAGLLSGAALKIGKTCEIFLQLNSSFEKEKSGFAPSEIMKMAETINSFPALEITGLMTIGPTSQKEDLIKASFEMTNKVFNNIKNAIGGKFRYLSMGMSGDFELALDYGANVLRIGTAIFGSRN